MRQFLLELSSWFIHLSSSAGFHCLSMVDSQSQCLTSGHSPLAFMEKVLGLVAHLAVDDLLAIASDEKVTA